MSRAQPKLTRQPLNKVAFQRIKRDIITCVLEPGRQVTEAQLASRYTLAHSFLRANITWRQEVGGSSIEASKIAGHSTIRMTEEYTKIQLTRQEELTRLIQERLASVGDKQPTVVQ